MRRCGVHFQLLTLYVQIPKASRAATICFVFVASSPPHRGENKSGNHNHNVASATSVLLIRAYMPCRCEWDSQRLVCYSASWQKNKGNVLRCSVNWSKGKQNVVQKKLFEVLQSFRGHNGCIFLRRQRTVRMLPTNSSRRALSTDESSSRIDALNMSACFEGESFCQVRDSRDM